MERVWRPYFRKDGRTGPYYRRKRALVIQLPNEAIIAEYNAGATITDLTLKYKVNRNVIHRRLQQYGAKMRSRGTSGARNPQYKGRGGYQTLHFYRHQSYEVAAICCGTPIPQGVVIHHRDENPKNNNPENLVLFPSQRAHCSYHQAALKLMHETGEVDSTKLIAHFGGSALVRPVSLMEWAPLGFGCKDLLNS